MNQKSATLKQVIRFLNRRIVVMNNRDSKSERNYGRLRELEYILGRITAHNASIRSLEGNDD